MNAEREALVKLRADEAIKLLLSLAEDYDSAPDGDQLSPEEAVIDFLHDDDVREIIIATLTAQPNAAEPVAWRKVCTMNCGPAIGDTRTADERKANCEDCMVVQKESPHSTDDASDMRQRLMIIQHIAEGSTSANSLPNIARIARGEGDLPILQRRDGKEPCGECHLKPGETCDICGAKNPAPSNPVADRSEEADRYAWLRTHFRFANDSMQEIWFDPNIDLAGATGAHEPNELDAEIDRLRALGKSNGQSDHLRVQACRDSDRNMLATDAGKELLTKAAAAMSAPSDAQKDKP